MKYLSHYTEEAHEALMERCGAFFAFNNHQFKEKAKEGTKYVGIGWGTYVPTGKAKELVDGVEKVMKEGIEADKKDHTAQQIIMRELENHEAFYSGTTEDTIHKLKDYGEGFQKDDILKVFNEAWKERVSC
jgi:hypothetical protein